MKKTIFLIFKEEIGLKRNNSLKFGREIHLNQELQIVETNSLKKIRTKKITLYYSLMAIT